MNNKDWYDGFVNEVHELEGVIKCDKCNSDNTHHSNPFGYTFLCGNCGNVFEYQSGKYKEEILFEFGEEDFDENDLDSNN